jgi:hypothetical protein
LFSGLKMLKTGRHTKYLTIIPTHKTEMQQCSACNVDYNN